LNQPAALPATMSFPFTAPFIWNGTDNVVIEFANCNGSASAFTSNQINNYTAQPANRTLYLFTDGTPGATVNDFYAYTAAFTATASVNRVNLTLDYTKPANYTWSPTTDLYTDAAATIPYTGGFAQKVYAKPNAATAYTVSAVTPLGCSALNTDTETAAGSQRQIAYPPLGTTPAGLAASCDANGWTYYYDTNNNNKIFMAVNWAPTGTLSPSNALAKATATVISHLDAANPTCTDQGKGVHVMKRFWNLSSPTYNDPIDVRFFYDPAEKASVETAAGAGHTFRWFRVNSGTYSVAGNVTGQTNGVAGGNGAAASTMIGTVGTDQGFTYVQFDGLAQFTGGTGVATEAPATASKLKIKVKLNSMDSYYADDYANTAFPLSDPYSTLAPFNTFFTHVNNGPLQTTTAAVLGATGGNAIVDWVFLQLRYGPSGATSVAYTQAALLQKDGDVVAADGSGDVNFPNAVNGNYYVAVFHRHNTGFRTDATVAISATTPLLDFTNGSVTLYGSTPLAAANEMNAGDANGDGSIDGTDSTIWEQQNGSFSDYLLNSDYNLDGSIDGTDSTIWELNNGKYQEID
jgi:hypothetical protein